MKVDNTIEIGNIYTSGIIITVYMILFVFLLPQKFQVEEIIDTPKTEITIPVENKNYHISGVPVINQFPELPTGCEITSAAMLLNFYGVNISKEVLAREVVKAPLPSFKNGRVEGESPYEYFVGDPRENEAFGVFNAPIFNLVSNYKKAENMTGCEFSDVIEQVKKGHPAMVWITRELKDVEYTTSWYVKDEMYWWPKGEHTVIIVGIEGDKVVVNDPYDGKIKSFEIERFKIIWEKMGKQAIIIRE